LIRGFSLGVEFKLKSAEQDTSVHVVAAVIQNQGRYLVCRRPPGKRHAGLWEFAGGKIEPGETVEQAVKRELAEELGVKAGRVGSRLFTARDPGKNLWILFVQVEIESRPIPLEHSGLQWLCPKELARLDLAPADRCFVECNLLKRREPDE
jgi:mutator protein MutT